MRNLVSALLQKVTQEAEVMEINSTTGLSIVACGSLKQEF
jgi:hypothetical protein